MVVVEVEHYRVAGERFYLAAYQLPHSEDEEGESHYQEPWGDEKGLRVHYQVALLEHEVGV